MRQFPIVTLLLALTRAEAASVMRREVVKPKTNFKSESGMEINGEGEDMNRHLVLHQADSSSPVDGLLFTQGGKPFKTDDFKKVCGTSTDKVACFKDLPIPVARIPTANMIKILQERPSVKLLSLKESMPRIVDLLKNNFDDKHVRQLLDSYAQVGIPVPAELSERFKEEQLGGSSFNELGEHEGDDHTPDDDVTEEDPKTHQKSINHHYVLHQQNRTAVADGVLRIKSGRAFTTDELDKICVEDSDLIECVKGLPMVVVRANTEHLKQGLKRLPAVEFDELKESLPEIVDYLKKHMGLKDAQELVDKYNKAGVPLPVEDIQKEFQKEGKDLK